MNTLALLVMTSCTAGADPLPAIDSRYSTIPSYGSYGSSGTFDAEPSRPRLFGRIRSFFRRRSQENDVLYPQASSTYPQASSTYPQTSSTYPYGTYSYGSYGRRGRRGKSAGTIVQQPVTVSPYSSAGVGRSFGSGVAAPSFLRPQAAAPAENATGATTQPLVRPQPQTIYPSPATPTAKPKTSTPDPF